jgi:hypothetical protein
MTHTPSPHINLPVSISTEGWADDLFAAAGTRPDPTVTDHKNKTVSTRSHGAERPAGRGYASTMPRGGALDADALKTIGEDEQRPPWVADTDVPVRAPWVGGNGEIKVRLITPRPPISLLGRE